MPIFDANGLEIPSPKVEDLEHICELGGQFDECCFYIEFHDELLDREAISLGLALAPTTAWNAGERRPVRYGEIGRTRTDAIGKWSLKIAVTDQLISDALQNFFSEDAAEIETWRQLSARWNGRVALVGKAKNWNREFTLSNEVLACIAARGLNLNFDAYFYGEETDEAM